MSNPQRIVVVVTLAAIALTLFWFFAGNVIAHRMQQAASAGLFSDLYPSPWKLSPTRQVLPGIVVPLALLGAAAFLVTGARRSRPE